MYIYYYYDYFNKEKKQDIEILTPIKSLKVQAEQEELRFINLDSYDLVKQYGLFNPDYALGV